MIEIIGSGRKAMVLMCALFASTTCFAANEDVIRFQVRCSAVGELTRSSTIIELSVANVATPVPRLEGDIRTWPWEHRERYSTQQRLAVPEFDEHMRPIPIQVEVRNAAGEIVRTSERPSDWVYSYANEPFSERRRTPLPPGVTKRFRAHIGRFITDLPPGTYAAKVIYYPGAPPSPGIECEDTLRFTLEGPPISPRMPDPVPGRLNW